MHYNFDLTIPKNTVITAEQSSIVTLNYGILRKVDIFFPDGCAGLVHVRILRWNSIVFPSNPDNYYTDNDYHLSFEEYYPILAEPFTLELRGYSEDNFRSHTISFRFLVINPKAISITQGLTISESELQELLGTYDIGGGV